MALLAWARTPAGAAEVFIRASQVGYDPNAVKVAMAFSQSPLPHKFELVREDNRRGLHVFRNSEVHAGGADHRLPIVNGQRTRQEVEYVGSTRWLIDAALEV